MKTVLFLLFLFESTISFAQPAIFNRTATVSGDRVNTNTSSPHKNNNKKEDYGSSPVHGKILKREITQNGDCKLQTEWYADGYVSTASTLKCLTCSGTTNCSYCGGTGRGSFGYFCTFCHGSGKCSWCHGVGSIFTVTGSYQNNNSVPNGGTVPPPSYNNGSTPPRTSTSNSSVYQTCKYCNGTGVCTRCRGKCGEWKWVYNSDSWIECGSCNGNGRCSICRGTGRL